MTIKKQGGIFGRNPTFNDVTVEGDLTTEGGLTNQGGITTAGNIISSEEGIDTPTADGITVERPTGSSSPTPAELRMSTTTQGGDWSTTDPWGRVAFYMKDTSGGGGKIHGSMEIRAAHPSGGRSRLALKTSSASADDLQDALVIDPDTGSGRNVTVSDGNLVIGTSGQGIDFSATSGTGTSELFDDYEEGEWTPAYGITGGSFSAITYNTAFTGGAYTKVGRIVTVVGYITTDSLTVGTDGNLVISGLPFAPLNTTGLSERSAVSIGDVAAWAASGYPLSGRLQSGTSSIFLQKRSAVDGATSAVQASDMGTTSQDNQLSFSVVYFA